MNILNQYKYAIYGVLALALLAGLAFFIDAHDKGQQAIGAARVQLQWDAANAIAAKAIRDTEERYQKELNDALEKDAELQRRIAVAHDNLLRVGGVFGDTVQTIIAGAAQDSADAARKHEAALGAVSAECSQRYIELAKEADGHAADSLKLQNAWPR